MNQYGKRLSEAFDRIDVVSADLKEAEDNAIGVLEEILRPVGKHGATVTCLDACAEDEFISLAEVKPFQFKPVTLVRYNEENHRVEVFVSEWEEYGKSISAEGEWMYIVTAHVDIHFLLDNVVASLEYADYYDEDDE